MDPYKPISVSIGSDTPPWDRIAFFVGHLDCRVYMTETAYLDVGAGSLPVILRVQNLPTGFSGSLGTIGRFCEVSDQALIMAAGEHDHDQPVNISMTALPLLRGRLSATALKAFTPINVGNGVVISTRAIVLPGIAVGDASVLGAGSILTRDAEAYGIYAGAPARLIRKRQSAAHWWNFDVSYIVANADRLQDLARDPDAEHPVQAARPRLIIRQSGDTLSISSFVANDEEHALEEAPQVRDYIRQAFSNGQAEWRADYWADQ